LQDLVDSSEQPSMATVTPTGVVASACPGLRRMLGRDPAGDRLSWLLEDHGTGIWRSEARRHDGTPFLVDVEACTQRDGGRRLLLREVRLGATTGIAAQLFQAAFDQAPIAMAICDTDGFYTSVNPAMARLLGRRADELVGRRDQEFTHPDDRESDVAAAWRILRGELDVWQTEKRFVAPDGAILWVIANLSFVRDERGRPLGWFGHFQDITAHKAREAQLRRSADEDPLTGLANRRAFERDLSALIARPGEHGALLYVDVDGFKAINDTRGHAHGDSLLRAIATLLDVNTRDGDICARIGGDEFAVVLPGACPVIAGRVADALAAWSRDGTVQGLPVPRLSVGIATFGDAPTTVDDVLADADRAMYRAKHASA
jgi:diguanylate cyclase (GGDEF)-like protein/PAS domain S-box-containing protein